MNFPPPSALRVHQRSCRLPFLVALFFYANLELLLPANFQQPAATRLSPSEAPKRDTAVYLVNLVNSASRLGREGPKPETCGLHPRTRLLACV